MSALSGAGLRGGGAGNRGSRGERRVEGVGLVPLRLALPPVRDTLATPRPRIGASWGKSPTRVACAGF